MVSDRRRVPKSLKGNRYTGNWRTTAITGRMSTRNAIAKVNSKMVAALDKGELTSVKPTTGRDRCHIIPVKILRNRRAGSRQLKHFERDFNIRIQSSKVNTEEAKLDDIIIAAHSGKGKPLTGRARSRAELQRDTCKLALSHEIYRLEKGVTNLKGLWERCLAFFEKALAYP